MQLEMRTVTAVTAALPRLSPRFLHLLRNYLDLNSEGAVPRAICTHSPPSVAFKRFPRFGATRRGHPFHWINFCLSSGSFKTSECAIKKIKDKYSTVLVSVGHSYIYAMKGEKGRALSFVASIYHASRRRASCPNNSQNCIVDPLQIPCDLFVRWRGSKEKSGS